MNSASSLSPKSRRAENQRRYRERNKDRIAAQQKQYRDSHRAELKQYRDSHRAELKQYQEWYRYANDDHRALWADQQYKYQKTFREKKAKRLQERHDNYISPYSREDFGLIPITFLLLNKDPKTRFPIK